MDNYGSLLRKALVEQHKIIFDYNNKKVRDEFCEYINCPVCNSSKQTTAFTKDWFNFSKCSACGMIYVNPRLNDKATYQFYNSEWTRIYNEKKFGTNTNSSEVDDKINYSNLRLINEYKLGKGALLEVGIGKGFFLKQASDAGYTVYGVELNKNNCESAIQLLGSSDHVYNMDLFETGFKAESFDVIYMRDVLEHVPNPKKLVAEFNRIAKKGCIIFIEVPNIDGWIYKLVKERHVCNFAFEHINYWSPKTLTTILTSCGFTVKNIYHESLDFKIAHILPHFIETNYSSVNYYKAPVIISFMIKVISKAFSLPPLNMVDYLLSFIANRLKRGSVIRVIAIK